MIPVLADCADWHRREAKEILKEVRLYPHIFTPNERRAKRREARNHQRFAQTIADAIKKL